MKKLRDKVAKVISGINYISLVICFLMVFIVAIDVILRKLKLGNINGSNEMTTYFMVVLVMLGIPALQIKDGHVWVNMFVNKMPARFRNFWRGFMMTIETAVIGLLAWGGYQKVLFFMSKNATTDILHMPKWIFAASCLLAFVEFFIINLIDTIILFQKGVKNEQEMVVDEWSDDQVKGI